MLLSLVFFFVKQFMTTVFPVQPGGWQPVSDDSTITIGTTSGLTASEYLIHFGEHGSDYYVFTNNSNEAFSVQLGGTDLTVNSDSVKYIQRVEQDSDTPTKYNCLGPSLMIDTALNSGGFQLTQRYKLGSVESMCAGKSILDVSTYDDSKLAYLYNNNAGISEINDFFIKPFTINSFWLSTTTITPNSDALYIIVDSSSDTELALNMVANYEFIKDSTIGGDTGIIVGDDFSSDKTLTITVNLSGNINLHGRTKPIIKFDESSNVTNLSINMDTCALDFVEPSYCIKTQALALKIGASGSPGAVLLEDISVIEFDTTTELTIRETSAQPTLTAPSANQVFALNVESAPSLGIGSVLFSVVNIDKSTLKPLTLLKGGYDDEGKYGIATKDAVYLVMFKLGEQSGDKWPAVAHVVGKINNNGVGVATVPTNDLIYLGEADKQQLVYISIGNGALALTTNVSMQYVLPYDTNIFRSADLKAAGVNTWPTQLTLDNTISCVGEIIYEFSKGTEDMFIIGSPNMFSTSFNDSNYFDIYNYINWSNLGFEMTDDKPTTKPIKIKGPRRIHINNVDDAILTKDYVDTTVTIYINQYIQTLTFENIADTWTQFTMSDAPFSLSSDTQFTDSNSINNIIIKPTTNVIKFTDGSTTRYFVIYDTTNNIVIDMPTISGRTATVTLDKPSLSILLYEITQTDGGAKAVEYHYKQVGRLINNVQNSSNFIGNIGLSNVYLIDDLATNYNFLDKYVFSSDKIGNVKIYATPPTPITTESTIPDYILIRTDLQHRDNIQSFDLIWILIDTSSISTLSIKDFVPTTSHTIESSPDMTITLTNEVNWTKDNQLILKGGTWIVNNKSNSEIGSIMNNGVSVITSAPGWENKYLSQIGANSSIQKNLQTIYDALGQTVSRVSVGDDIQYAVNVNNFSNDLFQELIDRISNAMQVSVSSGENKISDYVVKLGESSTDIKPIHVVFNIPSKGGSTPKEITAEVSLNLLTNNTDQSTEHDYYKMFYNTVEKSVLFSKDEGNSQLDSALFNGVAIKRVGQTPKLFFNNSVLVITTPLFAEDFDDELPDTITEQFISPTSNGRLVYKLVGVSNLILVDTVNKAGVVITDGFE